MTHVDVIPTLRSYDAALRENGATALFMFGSRARGDARPDSDLDLFIDYDPAAKIPSMFRLMRIEEEISAALGIPVTITTRNALHPLMRKSIERDAVRVVRRTERERVSGLPPLLPGEEAVHSSSNDYGHGQNDPPQPRQVRAPLPAKLTTVIRSTDVR